MIILDAILYDAVEYWKVFFNILPNLFKAMTDDWYSTIQLNSTRNILQNHHYSKLNQHPRQCEQINSSMLYVYSIEKKMW